MDPRKYNHLMLTKESRQWNGVKKVFSANGKGTMRHTEAKNNINNVNTDLTPCTKITDLNTKSRNYKTPRWKQRRNSR